MKLRKVLSVFALALLPVFGATQGCAVEEDPQSQSENVTSLTNFTIDVDAMNSTYPSEVPIAELADPWTAIVKLGDKTIPAPTHMFGDVINIIPYSNKDTDVTTDGTAIRGDEIIAKYYKPDAVGVALKHHRTENRVVKLDGDGAGMKEHFKLQDTHIEIPVGVPQAEHGHAGVITLNNPQSYEQGRFGNKTYAMVFLEYVFPGWAADYQKSYKDNMRTMAAAFNAVSDFPGDYNGGDPLGAHNPERLLLYVDNMVRAIAGDGEAQAWFEESENLIYCAELAFVSASAGLHAPLSKAFMEPRVGGEVWNAFEEQVELHNAGVAEYAESGSISNPSNFLKLNDNKRVGLVRLTIADDELAPMWALAPEPDLAKNQMALRPLTASDIVSEFMRTHLPRQLLGESLAPVQAAVLAKMKPGLYDSLGIAQLPEDHPARVAADQLFGQIVEVVGVQYGSYSEFRAALEPLLDAARQLTGPREGDGKPEGTGLFTPPSLFHVAAQGQYHGLVGMQYVGHGVHITNVKSKPGAEPPPEPEPVNESSCALAANAPDGALGNINSCGHQAVGGCWCDSLCEGYGDCCEDKIQTCGSEGAE